ncbi:MAG: sulfatase-like hydrolase/transferase [Myxococcales bacterium]|nr:sulfatase-like hydrolase/transferase [Myxococcales bacterium]
MSASSSAESRGPSARIPSAIGAAVLVLLAELGVVLGAERRLLAGVWELQWGLVYLAPAALLLAGAGGLLGAALLGLAVRGARRDGRIALALSVAVLVGLVGHGVGGGRLLAALPRRLGFALGVGLLAGALVYALAPRLAGAIRQHPRRVAAAALAAIVAGELANRFVLVRLYPAFHLGLAAACLALAPALGLALGSAPRRTGALSSFALGLGAVSLGLLCQPAAARLGRFDNFRLVMLERAPIAGQAVRAAALVAPPPPIVDADVAETDAPSPNARSVDFRGRDLLLITVDALRADHVGAYGYARKTTPNIDALAEGGALFTHAYAPTPHTSYSVTSLMTGKYMRPLLLQGAGADSDTWASLLRTYAYRTAAFYPPAVFFIDTERFAPFRDSFLGFEYRKVEFLEGQGRVAQVGEYLQGLDSSQRVFLWVHLFGPHEPYEAHPAYDFGARDVDRYDAEIRAADETAGALIRQFRAGRPNGIVIVTSDHGEEFGDHGGRYHGTTVYEEQVRVPLVVSAPGAFGARRISEVVQTIDLLPTVLSGLEIPRPPRLRGRDLGPLLSGERSSGPGLALAETEEQALIAEGNLRVVCQRKLGACQMFDVASDPGQTRDRSGDEAARFRELRGRLRELGASHGRYEVKGLRAEGKGWPRAILRGISGDGDAAEELVALLDDADVAIRRKATEILFELRRPETAPGLRLALGRDEDLEVRRWAALALTRLDQGAPLVYELERSEDLRWKRLASLALAESGDRRGEAVLVAWWKDRAARDYTRSRELLEAFAKIRSKDAVWPLTQSLDDVRLRPFIASTLARIGDEAARVPLARAFAKERYQGARAAIAEALVSLGAEAEMAEPLVRFLGVPDPLPGGLELARRAGILEQVGGPEKRELARLAKQSSLGAKLQLVVPRGGNGKGVRVIVRAGAQSQPGTVRIGAPFEALKYDRMGMPVKDRKLPQIHPTNRVALELQPGPSRELYVTLPESLGAKPGRPVTLVVLSDEHVAVESVAVVPLADELPAPPPKPWKPGDPPAD